MAQVTSAGDQSTTKLAQSRELHQGEKYRGNRQGVNRIITPEQKRQIRELYVRTQNGHQVARELGLGRTSVYRWLGLEKSKHPYWNDDEIQVMVDGYLEKKLVKEIARKIGRSPRAVRIKMCRYRKQIRKDPKKRRALSAITMAFRAIRKADIFRELEA